MEQLQNYDFKLLAFYSVKRVVLVVNEIEHAISNQPQRKYNKYCLFISFSMNNFSESTPDGLPANARILNLKMKVMLNNRSGV